jgi:hypothetical protein
VNATLAPSPRGLQALNLVAVVGTVAFNVWVSRRPLNGVTQGEISAAYPTLITPAGWAFAIWGLIYTGLLVFALYQLRPTQRSRPYLGQIGAWHAGAAVCNVSWLVVFHHTYGRPASTPLTLLPMYGLVACLLALYLRQGVGLRSVGTSQKLAVQAPFSLYLGWVSVAAMVNTAVVVKALVPDVALVTQRALSVIVLSALLVMGVLILRNRRDLAFALALAWAASGVASARQDEPVLATLALATALVLIGAALVLPLLRRESYTTAYLN